MNGQHAVGPSYAADNAVASVDIAEVSAVLELADELYILDVTIYNNEGSGTTITSNGVTISTYSSGEVMDSVLAVDKDTLLVSGNTGPTDRIVALFHAIEGIDIIVRAAKEESETLQMSMCHS